MASKTLVILEDDVDGSAAEETVQFSIDGVSYEIDLSGVNAQKLRKAVDPFRSAARRIGGRARRGSSSAPVSTGEIDTKAVRAWAESNGVEVSSRGRIAADVVEKYRKAGH